ncbi:MAG: hypothetical protein PHV34_02605 [Verrucomicrobiae bacterium]|nr:hypothetical protein [Verrucomicrobiae bacterium]
MFELNLFYEQQEIQREKDFDPVRLTVLGGSLILTIIVVWYGFLYLKMSDLRNELAGSRAQLKKLDSEFKQLGALTDLPKIRTQAQSINNRIHTRVMVATHLGVVRDLIPTNCQVRSFNLRRGMASSEVIKRGPKGSRTVKKVVPSAEITLEIEARGKTKVEVLQIRDRLLDVFQKEPRFRDWLKQSEETGATNRNDVVLAPGMTSDPKLGEQAVGVFELRLPFAPKDKPREL